MCMCVTARVRVKMFPKEIQNIINSYYQSYFIYELNQDFLSNYKFIDSSNGGLWKKNGQFINFFHMNEIIASGTWKNCHDPGDEPSCDGHAIVSFITKNTSYGIPARYFTTLIESDLSESEKAKTLIKRPF